MLRTTCVATMLKGGHASNALPQTAEAGINCRMTPDARISDVRAMIVKVLDDPQPEVSSPPNREPRSERRPLDIGKGAAPRDRRELRRGHLRRAADGEQQPKHSTRHARHHCASLQREKAGARERNRPFVPAASRCFSAELKLCPTCSGRAKAKPYMLRQS
jgi:hypothetical protein